VHIHLARFRGKDKDGDPPQNSVLHIPLFDHTFIIRNPPEKGIFKIFQNSGSKMFHFRNISLLHKSLATEFFGMVYYYKCMTYLGGG